MATGEVIDKERARLLLEASLRQTEKEDAEAML
jgi:hypothetical protein